MKISELCEILGGELLCGDGNAAVAGGYCGDFLSFVMGRAKAGGAWFTVMTNVNVAGVAVLSEVGAIVLCEGVSPNALLLAKARTQGLNLLRTELPVYESARLLALAEEA